MISFTRSQLASLYLHWLTLEATCVPSGLVSTRRSPAIAFSGLKSEKNEHPPLDRVQRIEHIRPYLHDKVLMSADTSCNTTNDWPRISLNSVQKLVNIQRWSLRKVKREPRSQVVWPIITGACVCVSYEYNLTTVCPPVTLVSASLARSIWLTVWYRSVS